MKILYHHRTLGDGAEGIHVAEIIKAFKNLGHEVRVVSLIGEKTNVVSKKQNKWSNIKKLMPGFLYEIGEMAYNIQGYRSIGQAVAEFNPDFIYDRYVSYNYSAVGTGRRHNIPVILEVNAPYADEKQTFDEKLFFKNLASQSERKICRDATIVIVVSTPLKEILISKGIPEQQIVVMPNGADPDVFHPSIDGTSVRQRYNLQGKIVIGFTGILRPWHGIDLLVDAFGNILDGREDLHFLIVGDGPIRSELERDIAAKGLSQHIAITGRQSHDVVSTFVAAMDITVSPRATPYASPMKILEYMAMGKTVVAPDTSNIRDIISHGKDGILFQAEEVGSLTKALNEVVNDSELRMELGKNARKKIEDERTWSHNAAGVISLIKGLTDEKHL